MDQVIDTIHVMLVCIGMATVMVGIVTLGFYITDRPSD